MISVSQYILHINRYLLRLQWSVLILILLMHFSASWLLLALVNERALADPQLFYYFYVVTASTVGYGDLSPETGAGRFVVSFFVIPGGITLFAALIGKITTVLINIWRQSMKGQLDLSNQLHDHMVIMGWHKEATSRMIDLIFGDLKRTPRDVVLVATQTMDNPDPQRIHFIRTDNLASADACHRAAVTKAERIIINGQNDDNTLTTALNLVATQTKAHIVCHFHNRSMALLLQAHAPRAECHISTTTEMLVRSAQDPGSSRIQGQLLDTLTGPTQFSLQVPKEFSGCLFSTLINQFKNYHDALALGVAGSIHGDDLLLNPPADYEVKSEQLIYYMATQRLLAVEIDWQRLQAG